jgi:hypothetical protein
MNVVLAISNIKGNIGKGHGTLIRVKWTGTEGIMWEMGIWLEEEATA